MQVVVGRLEINNMGKLKMNVSVSRKKKTPLETTPRSLAKKINELNGRLNILREEMNIKKEQMV